MNDIRVIGLFRKLLKASDRRLKEAHLKKIIKNELKNYLNEKNNFYQYIEKLAQDYKQKDNITDEKEIDYFRLNKMSNYTYSSWVKDTLKPLEEEKFDIQVDINNNNKVELSIKFKNVSLDYCKICNKIYDIIYETKHIYTINEEKYKQLEQAPLDKISIKEIKLVEEWEKWENMTFEGIDDKSKKILENIYKCLK